MRDLGASAANTKLVVPGERKRDPGPILRSKSRVHGVWVPAFAGTTKNQLGNPSTRCERMLRWMSFDPDAIIIGNIR